MATPLTQLISGANPVPEIASETLAVEHGSLFINRDLSLIEFFSRVLDEALDTSTPLLERLKFLSIVASNIDEFYMVRMSGLRDQAGSLVEVARDGMSAADVLAKIRMRLREIIGKQSECLVNDVLPALNGEGIVLESYSGLSDDERQGLQSYFEKKVYPILTPQAVDPSHPFPYISGQSLNIGVMVRPLLSPRVSRALKNFDDELFVRMKIPRSVPRLVPVDGHPSKFIFIEDLIASNIQFFVPGARPADCHFFRITRDADIELLESEAEDLLESMEQNLKQRRFGEVTRLEVSEKMPDAMVDYLTSSLEAEKDDVYRIKGPISIAGIELPKEVNRPDLNFAPLRTVRPEIFDGSRSMFDLIKDGDILLHHPYLPYSIITDFIREATEDPDVLAIKICLYRMGADSPIPPLLIRASELGKQVTVLIELKARFDEANNIEWAKRLEQAGVHVIYGLLGLKTHAKTTLIVRREGDELRRYVHAATGNYNPETSAAYTDLGLLTVDGDIGADATELFNFLTVYSQRLDFRKLLVAPINLRERMLELINREAEHARRGVPARIIAKLNRLADTEIVNSLYEASKAGVEIDLVVRGICTLRPGIPGLSENIRVRSVVGRLLEHSRIYYFENAGNAEIFLGSSDWMPRNLDRRVEVLTPVEDPAFKTYLRNEYLASYLRDNCRARELAPDGTYHRPSADGEELFDCQLAFQGDTRMVAVGR